MHHSLSLSLLGSVSAWGWNGVGQLGDGPIVLSGGYAHTVAG